MADRTHFGHTVVAGKYLVPAKLALDRTHALGGECPKALPFLSQDPAVPRYDETRDIASRLKDTARPVLRLVGIEGGQCGR